MQEKVTGQELLSTDIQRDSSEQAEAITRAQENPTEQDRPTLHSETGSQPEHSDPPALQGEDEKQKNLTFEEKDFICKQVALFKSYKEVAELFLLEFPDAGFTLEQILKRIKYYACDNRTRKWRHRVVAYRDQLNHNLANRIRLANKYERLRHLEAMFHEAMQPRIKRLFWYPVRRRNADKVIYRALKVKERDIATAAKILRQIASELDYDCLKLIDDPYMVQRRYEDPKTFREDFEAYEKSDPEASRDLDKTFGLI